MNTNQIKISMRRGLIALVIGLGWTAISHADVKVSGYVESTYMYDFNRATNPISSHRVYDQTGDSFYLNAAHVSFSGELEEGIGYVVEVDYGHDATVNTGDDDVDIQEAYINVPAGPLAVTVGKFVTYEGFEVIEGPDNPTISRGYLFGFAEAFTHVGVKGHIPLGDKVDVGVGVVNGRDVDVDNNQGKTAIWRVGLDMGDPFSVGFSGSHGAVNATSGTSTSDDDNLTSLDLTGSFGLIPKLPLGFQVFYGQQDNAKGGTILGKWTGFGLHPVFEWTEKFSIGGRIEYFDDADRNNRYSTNYTLAPAYKVNEATLLRLEVRRDIVNSTVDAGPFYDEKGNQKGTMTSVSAGLSYMF